jgi:hypothetical protein
MIDLMMHLMGYSILNKIIYSISVEIMPMILVLIKVKIIKNLLQC